MKYFLLYYLAGLTWLLEIIMFATIVLIPSVLYLRWKTRWFEKPFEEVRSMYWE